MPVKHNPVFLELPYFLLSGNFYVVFSFRGMKMWFLQYLKGLLSFSFIFKILIWALKVLFYRLTPLEGII